MVKQLNIPDLTPDVVKLKIKSIRTYLKLKKVVLAETISMYRNYSG
jgi:DNA-binding transcriptional regulator YiaG